AESYVGHKLCWPDDLVINSLWAWSRGLGVSRHHGIVSTAYGVYRCRDTNAIEMRFVDELVRSSPFHWELRVRSKGVWTSRLQLTDESFLSAPFPIPPLSEQAAIVRFLDHADRKIRRYIRAKQKLIKLLEEQKQAIIHRAVTRGLDPDVRLKPSCVEWLGDVPEHWYIVALKHVLKRLIDCEHKTAPAIDHSDFRVVRTTAVRNGNLRWSGTYCTTAEAFQAWTQRAIPEPGDVIFTREAPAGEACLVPEGVDICLGQRTVLMKLRRDQYDGQFLVHMIYAGPPRMRIQLASQGSTVGHFNMDDIGWMKVLAPPLQEQQRIVEAIKKGTVELARTIEKANREIDLLQEYRTRLIADVVTGKLDVREAAAGLLEEEPVADEVLSEPYDQDDAEDSLDDESFPSEEE
ncbi:MAG: restriction endonuclease subunit S, partial [Cyanobium sp.]